MYEECQAAILLLQRDGRQFDEETLRVFERWLDGCVENWAVCDSLCLGLVHQFFAHHPNRLTHLQTWARSPSRWRRRAACVTLSKLCRRGEHWENVVSLADSLLSDTDVMVQKGVGWLLKVASQSRPDDVIAFLNQRRGQVPSRVKSYAKEYMTDVQR
ncbi:MAG: DNA alkylation repair protein, partial [Chloroflexi bacterium]|nr:DNA alkylation repair protein [Chloroflexota bacterium]